MAAKIEFLTAEEFADFNDWFVAAKPSLPDIAVRGIGILIAVYSHLALLKSAARDTLQRLREAMGIQPKSERSVEAVKDVADESDSEFQSPEEQLLQGLIKQRSSVNHDIRKYRRITGRERKSTRKSVAAQQPAKPLAHPKENVFHTSVNQITEKQQKVSVDKVENFSNPKGLHTVAGGRTRYDTEVKVTKINYEVETVTDPRTGKSVTASMDHIGPRGWQVTWVSVATIINCVVGYAIPINRLAKMLGANCKYFTSGRITEIILMAARIFEPVYSHMGESLADADILSGDDTPTKVLEIEQILRDGDSDAVTAPAKSGLSKRIGDIFGRVSWTKDGKRPQKQFNVSLLSGKTNADDPRSYVFFFHAHLGHLGNLLTKLLEIRSPKKSTLTLQTDLLSANLPSSKMRKTFRIFQAGCASHCRRPFFRYRHDDPSLCFFMLRGFALLSMVEDRINEVGRTFENTERFRKKFSLKIWAAMRRRAEAVLDGDRTKTLYWPSESKLYKACQYLVKNYDALTLYISDARLELTNNMRERLLRWDKIMLDSSKFRKTEQGRAAIDILRTIVHSAAAAEIDLLEYLKYVFVHHKEVSENPERFTPYAYALSLEEKTQS